MSVTINHGTRTGYGQGCHCGSCMEAMRAYMRAYNAKRKADARARMLGKPVALPVVRVLSQEPNRLFRAHSLETGAEATIVTRAMSVAEFAAVVS